MLFRNALTSGDAGGGTSAAISNGLAELHARLYGRVPAEAKAHVTEDLVVCLLWDSFTTVERTLLGRGEVGAVEAFRRTFQRTMEDRFNEVVEAATGRRVHAHMSQVHAGPDVAVDLFVLEP